MCAVIACSNYADPKHATCLESEHCNLEIHSVEAHTVMFQLQRWLECLKIYYLDDEHQPSTLMKLVQHWWLARWVKLPQKFIPASLIPGIRRCVHGLVDDGLTINSCV